MKISAKTKICMVIGDPIEHSLSPLLHNTGYQHLGIDDQFVYVAANVKIENIKACALGIHALGIRGVSCTMPHKLEIMKYLDKIDPTAKEIGAVNTVVNDNGVLIGYNTDWLGVVEPLKIRTSLSNKKVAVIGAGGASRAIVYGLREMGCVVTIYNRTLQKAKLLAEELCVKAKSLTELDDLGNTDIIINATSVGMAPDIHQTPIPKQYISKHHIVLDAIYNPGQTQLLKDAQEQKAVAIQGFEMLLYQAVAQFELYTGHKAPIEEMKKVLIEHMEG